MSHGQAHDRDGMATPRVAVSMPARNVARFVGEAARSVLAQDMDLELVVVDDASSDETAQVVASITDPRLRLLRNPVRRGIGYCHNRVVANTVAPYIAHVDADDLIVPGALAKVIAALERAPRAGQAYCHFTPIDADGKPTPDAPAFEARLVAHRRHRRDPRHELVRFGMVVNHLRTYRRTALAEVGPFYEGRPYGHEDHEMAVRLADRFEFVLIPEFLYLHRRHGGNVTETLRCKALRFWWRRARACPRLARSGRVRFLASHPWRTRALLALGLFDALGGGTALAAARRLRPRA